MQGRDAGSVRPGAGEDGAHARRARRAGQPVPLVTATEDGIRVTDVWQTREAFEAFAGEQIGPLIAEVGFPAPPEITFHDVHNYDSADVPA